MLAMAVSALVYGAHDRMPSLLDAPRERATGAVVELTLPASGATTPGVAAPSLAALSPVPFAEPALQSDGSLIDAPTAAPPQAAEAVVPQRVRVVVAAGDTLAGIFQRQGLSATTLDRILRINEQTRDLARLRVGQFIEFDVRDGELQELVHERDLKTALVVSRNANGDYTAEQRLMATDTRIASAHGRISSSLFEAAQASGLSDAMGIRLAEVFGYDIDFVLDIRDGDEFTVIYEQLSRSGRESVDGDILAAEFVNDGKVYRAVRYVSEDGTADYYSTEGASLRKSFLRTPVNFTRISSHFNLRRKHPVLNTIRAHKGVDYAAPIGTPVRATGDGKVLFVGNKGGYGRTVILQHGDRYRTVYAHLSRYARAIGNGQRVRQGQTIGYVGKSGLATGPHLHYEFQVDGAHRNPLTIDLPRGESIPERLLADFRKQTSVWLAELETAKRDNALAERAAPSGRSLVASPDIGDSAATP
jgi:murein DD-endopeptidase MepM/ murein hydrolase activator NlpD